MFYVIDRIKSELVSPYKNNKENIDRQVTNLDEFFYQLTGEDKYTFWNESVINAKITKIEDGEIRIITPSGIPGIISSKDIFYGQDNPTQGQIESVFQIGQTVKIKITNIKKDKYNIYGKICPESLYVDNDFLDKNDVL